MDDCKFQFRYDTRGEWIKGNTHIHSTVSDGGKSFAELAELYAGAGYDFLCRTDHGVASDVSADTESYPLLWLDGIEINGQDEMGGSYHVVCLGTLKEFSSVGGFVATLESARRQDALLILAHPHWMGNSLEDALRWRFDGVEIYNHVCHWLNGKSNGMVHWSAMLAQDPNTLAFSVDDAHTRPEHPGWNGGWIMVNAPERSQASIMDAIRRGNYYSTCGPEFHAIELDGTDVHLATSPVQFVRLAGPGSSGARLGSFDGQELTEATMTVPRDWDYAYLEIEDHAGRRAWTNTLFTKKPPATNPA